MPTLTYMFSVSDNFVYDAYTCNPSQVLTDGEPLGLRLSNPGKEVDSISDADLNIAVIIMFWMISTANISS